MNVVIILYGEVKEKTEKKKLIQLKDGKKGKQKGK